MLLSDTYWYFKQRRQRLRRQKLRKMNTKSRIVIVLYLMALSPVVVESSRTINMGVLLPYTGLSTPGYSISGAVPLAMEYVNSNPSLNNLKVHGYNLNFTIYNCPCDVGEGLAAFAEVYAKCSEPPIDVYIG